MKIISRILMGFAVCVIALILSPIIAVLGAILLAIFAVLLQFIWAIFAFWIIGCIVYGVIATS